MQKTVLVTGGAGYIGSHVVLELLSQGYTPIILDDLSTGSRSNIPADVTFYHGDVGSPGLVARVLTRHDIRSVMHFAGSIVVSDSVARPIDYYRNNTCRALELAAQCVKSGVAHFVFSSTAAVYGLVEAPGPVTESALPSPISPYGSSKLMTEMMLRDISAAHPSMQALSLRYFNVAGADPEGRVGQGEAVRTHLIRSAIDTHLGLRSHLDIFGTDYETRDGTCERDFIHVSDLAAVHVAALRYLEAGGASSVINCGYGRGTTVREVIAALEALTGSELPVQAAERRPGDAPSVVADVTRMKALFEWTPRYDQLPTILETALNWQAGQQDKRRAFQLQGEGGDAWKRPKQGVGEPLSFLPRTQSARAARIRPDRPYQDPGRERPRLSDVRARTGGDTRDKNLDTITNDTAQPLLD